MPGGRSPGCTWDMKQGHGPQPRQSVPVGRVVVRDISNGVDGILQGKAGEVVLPWGDVLEGVHGGAGVLGRGCQQSA